MKNVRLNLTNDEQLAKNALGLDNVNFNMAEGHIDKIINKEKETKFNSEVEKYVERLDNHSQELKNATEQLSYDISKLEIKPTFGRILITLFSKNPFLKITTTKSGIITDMGGLNPTFKNTDSGEIQEAELVIIVGVIQEIGPDVKYAKPGDTIFVDKNSIRPVPFYKLGLYCLGEQQIIAIVNEGLEERFNEIKDGRN